MVLIVPLGAIAAGLMLTVGLLAARVGNLGQQVNSLRQQAGVTGVLLNPAHRTVELTSAAHPVWRATVVILPDGDGYLINPSMPAIASSQTFQLWALSRERPFPWACSGHIPRGCRSAVEPTMTALMISAEPLGGTPAPTTPVLVQGNLPVGL